MNLPPIDIEYMEEQILQKEKMLKIKKNKVNDGFKKNFSNVHQFDIEYVQKYQEYEYMKQFLNEQYVTNKHTILFSEDEINQYPDYLEQIEMALFRFKGFLGIRDHLEELFVFLKYASPGDIF